jgi:hypothetical protein
LVRSSRGRSADQGISSIFGNKINKKIFDGICKGGRSREGDKRADWSRRDSKTHHPFLGSSRQKAKTTQRAAAEAEAAARSEVAVASPPGEEALGIWLGSTARGGGAFEEPVDCVEIG